MNIFKKWKLQRIELELIGKRARLKAINDLTSRAEEMPGSMVYEIINLSQKIAELEEDARRIKGDDK